MSLAKNVEFLRRLSNLSGIKSLGDFGSPSQSHSPLLEVTDFGANPGDLKMFSFVPDDLQPKPALVVVLHGCGQTAAGYDLGAGWSSLATHYGFALLMPQQQPSNNANGCFNWFNPEDTARDSGEACSIREMIARMVGDIGIDPIPGPMDFSAWFDVYLSGAWHTFDARHNKPRIGRILMARGRDATDTALTTTFGPARLVGFDVHTGVVDGV